MGRYFRKKKESLTHQRFSVACDMDTIEPSDHSASGSLAETVLSALFRAA